MARVSDTREKVRALAQRIHDEGGSPTPTIIRKMLGKGSPNTIVDELRAWAEGRTPVASPAQETAQALSRMGLAEMAALLEKVAGQNEKQHEFLHRAAELLKSSQQLPDMLVTMTSRFEALTQKMASDREWLEQQLKLISSRYEGVQRHSLLQVNEAREEAVKWKQKYSSVKDELATWRTTLEQKNSQLQSEVAWLKGKAGEALTFPSETPAPSESAARHTADGSYSGHPRARVLNEQE